MSKSVFWTMQCSNVQVFVAVYGDPSSIFKWQQLKVLVACLYRSQSRVCQDPDIKQMNELAAPQRLLRSDFTLVFFTRSCESATGCKRTTDTALQRYEEAFFPALPPFQLAPRVGAGGRFCGAQVVYLTGDFPKTKAAEGATV